MEKKKSSGGEEAKRSTRQKIFGTNSPSFSGDVYSGLVGSIVEKGIVEKLPNKPASISFPKPTVLPFPVARHRSEGPYWQPVNSKTDDDNNDGSDDNFEDDEEDKDFMEFDPVKAHANPVQRRNKKGLDFSRWKEFIQEDNSPLGKKPEERMLHSRQPREKKMDGEQGKTADKGTSSSADTGITTFMEAQAKPQSYSSDSGIINSVSPMELDNSRKLDLQESTKDARIYDVEEASKYEAGSNQVNSKRMPDDSFGSLDVLSRAEQNSLTSRMDSCSTSDKFVNEPISMTLESQIDAENQARIKQMSAQEIAEAHAEIVEKMSPALLRLLQKRGEEKLRKKSNLVLEAGTGHESVNQHAENVNDAKSSLLAKNDVSSTLEPPLENKEKMLDDEDNMTKTSTTGSSSSWNAWSDRVEAVRELRFSLAGDIVENSIDLVSVNDNLTERDYLRSEGDPGAAGYTIKEAVALTRSVVPGQRVLALRLLSSVLEKVLDNICKHKVGHLVKNEDRVNKSVDWEAVWAFALGPEPELVLALRMCLDDNHSSVVLACVKAIECVLCCNVNENFFDISEKKATYDKDICTAPVFRTKPDINVGFLHGGFWKYSAKPSNILPFPEDSIEDETEGKHTIQDDVAVAGQDFTAGLVRMGILPRLRYLLETDPTAAMEECIMSILVAIARHSPSCATAVLNCQRLIQTVVRRFTVDSVEIRPSMIKSVGLFKVLARLDQKNCLEFIKNGYFRTMTWHLYQHASSIDHWVKLGKEKCKLGSALIVEQLRFWKVCIRYGYCASYFSDTFPALSFWLNPPSFEKLIEKNVLSEFASISSEAYLVLESLTRRLPKLFSQQCQKIPKFTDAETEVWSWNYVGPVVDLAVKWIATRSDPQVSKLFEGPKKVRAGFASQDLLVTPLLWVYAAAIHMLFRVLERLTPEDAIDPYETGGSVPWLPEFVPKIGLQLIKFWLLGFSVSLGSNGGDPDGHESFIEELICLRENGDHEMSLASVCCLNGMVKTINTIDHLIKSAKDGICGLPPQNQTFSKEGKILEDGILNAYCVNLKSTLNFFTNLVASGWQCMLSIETFGRGGPAPGVGIGWGAPGGGFWSKSILLAQTDAIFLIHLLETLKNLFINEPVAEERAFIMQRINSAFGFCLIAGPGDGIFMEKAVDLLFDVSVLKYLDLCIQNFLLERRGETFKWQYEEEDYLQFSRLLSSHFRRRWLSVKLKSNVADDTNVSGAKTSQKGSAHLDTIFEDVDMSNVKTPSLTSLAVEWARQRLPLPVHFYLSPISTIVHSKRSGPKKFSHSHNIFDQTNLLEVARSGLFFVLGVEAMSSFQHSNFPSPVQHVSLTWKLHSLSVNFLVGMELLEQEQGKETFEALQDLYGELLDKERSIRRKEVIQNNNSHPEFLRFQSEIFESYSTIIEDLVEQFSAISYGDLIFGRQVALYLHRCVESSIRLAAWNALSNAHVLELLPPLEKCIAGTEGYLDPVEDNEAVLDAYVKSWVSGTLDRAAIRGSVAYSLVVHHLSSFLFHVCPADKLFLRNRLVRSLLRDYAEKQQHEGLMLSLIRHNKPLTTSEMDEQKGGVLQEKSWLESRLKVLAEACEGYSSLLTQVNKLKAIILGNS
ncbi:transcriptional elongation regulator MINIYO [Neltuma alba]|uniref:transcriptional elongation regulator MINIYO n=1 Tax=Neltuma alba TaxID=207710 RepID=UPI0010A4D801|nr:transcriptional elongation regulator MINIYO [Prosopis alba]